MYTKKITLTIELGLSNWFIRNRKHDTSRRMLLLYQLRQRFLHSGNDEFQVTANENLSCLSSFHFDLTMIVSMNAVLICLFRET
jgi:hypothetical protein